MLKNCIILLLLVTIKFATAQNFHFDTYGHESGITQASGISFTQDTQGFLWVSTFDGVNRFDGRTFKNFNKIPGDSTSLIDNNIIDILSDHKGFTWVLTSSGLCRYNPEVGSFEKSLLGNNTNQENLLFEDAQNNLWIFNNEGATIIEESGTKEIAIFPDKIFVNDVFQINYDNFWFATNNGIYTFQRSNSTLKQLYLKNIVVKSIVKDIFGTLWFGTTQGLFKKQENVIEQLLIDSPINSLLIDKQNNLWIIGNEIHQLKISTNTLVSVSDNSQNSINTSNTQILSIFEDNAGGIWIGTDGFGIKHYNPNKLNFKTLIHNPFNLNSLPSPFVTSIYEGDKYIWIGTSNGLSNYDFHTRTTRNFFEKDGLRNNRIHCITNWQNELIVGTDAGLNTLVNNRVNKTASFYNADGKSVRSLFSENDTLWIGTTTGLFYATKENRTLIKHLQIQDRVEAIRRANDNYLWVGTINGAYRINNNRIFHHYMEKHNLANNSVKSIEIDGDKVWIGTKGGLSLFDEEQNSFINYYKKDGLPNNVIYGILSDKKGYLWLSTNAGLCQFHPDSLTFQKYDLNDNLQDYEFNTGAYHRGRSSYMYFGGINGMNYFSPYQLIKENSPPKTIVTEIQLDRKTLIVSKSGVLKKDPSVLKVLDLNHQQNNLIFKFTGLSFEDPIKIKFRYQLVNLNTDWVETNLPFAEFTNLSPGKYEFIVSSASRSSNWSNPTNPIVIIISPPIWGETWVQLLAGLLFITLLYSTYKFRVRSLNMQRKNLEKLVQERTNEISAQNEELQVQTEAIEIKSEKLAEQKEELHALNTQLEKMVENRTLELTNTNKKLVVALDELDLFVYRSSHDLRGPLATLLGLIQVAKMELIDKPAITLISKIEKTVHLLDQTLSKLLTINIINKGANIEKSVAIEAISRTVVNEFQHIIEKQKSSVKINIASELTVDTDSVLIKIIFEHLLANSLTFKTTEPVDITISSETTPKGIEIHFSDTGPGINSDIQPLIYSMFFRGSEQSVGNGLGLYIVKKILEKLKGTISLSTKNIGTTFIITLPK